MNYVVVSLLLSLQIQCVFFFNFFVLFCTIYTIQNKDDFYILKDFYFYF